MLNVSAPLSEPKNQLPKYHPDGPFMDPLIRCNNCGELDQTEKWKKRGHCLKCGNRRLRNVINLSETDYVKAMAWGIDIDFLKLFEQVADD